METKANYAIVGFFTVLVMIAAFAFVYWMNSFGRGQEQAELAIRIPGSAYGLSIGSPVRFNGIAVGKITQLAIDPNDPSYALAIADVSILAPLTQASRVSLEIEGLTGTAYLEMTGGNPGDENILMRAFEQGLRAEVEADPSSLTNLLATADQIMQRADRVMGDVEAFVEDARPPLTETLKNAAKFSQTLTDNADGIDQFLKSVATLSETINGLSVEVETTVKSAKAILNSIEPDRVNSIVSNVDTISGNFVASSESIDETLATVNRVAQTLETSGQQISVALNQVALLIDGIDQDKIGTAINDIAAASSAARGVVENIEGVSKSIGGRSAEIDKAIGDFAKLAENLGSASDRIDGVLAKADSSLGKVDEVLAGVDGQVVGEAVTNFAAASETARTVLDDASKVSSALAVRTPEIEQAIADIAELASNLGTASQQFDTVLNKANSSLGRVDDVLANVDGATVGQAVTDFAAASASARTALDDTNKVTATLANRTEDIDQIVTDIGQMANRLNAVSSRVDGVLAKVDSFIGAGEGTSVLDDVRETLDSFRRVADNLDQRIGPIAANLQRFSGSGLRQVESLVIDARRSLNRIESSISSIERDPQRLLFGGDTVKQYDGRNRR